MSKRICMIAYSIFPYDARVKREAETLAKYGYQVKFLALAENDEPRTYEMNGVEVVEMKMKKYRGKKNSLLLLSYLKFLFLAFLCCSKLFLKKEIDFVHIHNMPNFLVFAGILPRIFRKKVILDIHDSTPETYESKFRKFSRAIFKLLCWEEALCCGFAHRLICVNDVQRDVLIARGIDSKKIRIILNVPDEGIFKFDRERALAIGEGNNKFNIVYHGTLDRMLGIDLVIEAVAGLIEEIPCLHFYAIGLGRNMDEFVSLSAKMKIESRIHFSQKAYPVESLPVILREMDVGIIPNRRNTATELMLPVKLLEYVSLGIPVVSARLRAIEHYFSDDMLCYFEAESVESMGDAILRIYKDKDKRKEQVLKAMEFVKKYGWERHQIDLIRTYEEL